MRKQLHGRDTNLILQLASSIKTEKLSYKAFQKMFGKSIARKAPSKFLKMLKQKIESQGGEFREFPTTLQNYLRPVTVMQKKTLKERWHTCECGVVANEIYTVRF